MTRKRRGLSMTSILVLALVGTITAIVLGAMAVFLQTYQRSLIRSVQTSARQSVAQVGKTVEDYLDDVNSLMELLERKLEDPRQDRDDFFAAFLQIRPDVVAVTTYDAAGGLVDCRSRAAKRTEIYQNLSFDPDKMDDYAGGYVSTPHVASIFQGYYPWVVTLVAPLDAPGREEWIALDISFSSISAYLNDVGIGQHGYCFLMDQSGNIIYHPQQQLIYSDLKRENTSLIAGLPDGSNESGSMIYTLTSLENSHWRVVGVSFVEELITESVQEVSRILVASGIGILLAAVIISFVLFRTLSRPMHGLTAAMRQFEQAADNFTYVPVGGAREVRALSDSFGQMVVQIQRLMEQVRAEEVNLRKTELRALQAQINPHFLYNTLDSIAWMCAAAAAEAVCGIPALQTLTGGAGEGRFARLGIAVGNGGDIAPALRRFDRLPRQKYGTVVEAKGKMDSDVREIGTPRQTQGIRGAQHALWAVDEQQIRGLRLCRGEFNVICMGRDILQHGHRTSFHEIGNSDGLPGGHRDFSSQVTSYHRPNLKPTCRKQAASR